MNKSLWAVLGVIILLVAGIAAYQSVKNPAMPARPQTNTATSTNSAVIPSGASGSTSTSATGGTANQGSPSTQPVAGNGTGAPSVQENPNAVKSYTMAEVATHNNASSCWTVVSGKVYDVTSFIGRHPGGEAAIKSLYGKDGTSQFMNQHSGDSRPERMLASLSIGVLK